MVDKKVFAGLGIIFVLLLLLAIILVFGKTAEKKTDLDIYYINPTDFLLEKRIITIEGEGDLKLALTTLFNGPNDKNLENLFPKDIKYISSKVDNENETLVIDLSSNTLSINYGLEVNYLYIMSIVHTAGAISGYENIKLTFDGKEVEFFNNGMYLGDALKRDYSVVK